MNEPMMTMRRDRSEAPRRLFATGSEEPAALAPAEPLRTEPVLGWLAALSLLRS